MCEAGEFESDATGTCEVVVEGVKTNVDGMKVQTLDLEPGFWRTYLNSDIVLPCLNSNHCNGGVNTSNLCSDGYTGPLCAVCVSGYAATGSGELLVCTECTGQSIFAVVGGLALVFLLLALLLFVVFKRTGEKTHETFRSRTSTIVENVSERMDKIAPIAKIVAAYFQVAGGLGLVYGLAFPKFFTTFSSYIGALSD